MSLKTVQSCEMCGRSRQIQTELDQDNGGWRVLNSGPRPATLCNVCMSIVVNHANSRAHSRKAGIEFPPDIKFFEAQASDRTE